LFLWVESEETPFMISNRARFWTALTRRNYEGLVLTAHIFDQETHGSIWGAAFSWSLRVLYEK
jgi:hypothetical protein